MPAHEDLFDMIATDAERPPMRRGFIRRDDILRRLAATAHSATVVVLVAPAGYGKTTVLSQWAALETPAFAWLSIDDADNDPVRLVRHIVLALQRLEPIDERVLASLTSPDSSVRGVLVPRLLTWLAGRSRGWVLVLDDLHRLHNRLSLDVMEALARQLPPGWRLGLASRSRPDLQLSRLRRQHRYLELGPEDLTFSLPEASALLAIAGVDVSPAQVQSLLRRTEGWPAGIYLAALSLREGPQGAGAAGITGDDARLVDYFRTEVLQRQPVETVTFLLRSAVLERMSGPLCDAVLATSGSAARLVQIESSNLFVVPQDRRGEWYRYHGLFADMLLSELRRRQPGAEHILHRRAAVWFSEHGLMEEAINHALAGRDVGTAARLTTMCAQRLVNTGRIATVRSWIEAMGEAGPAAYPPLSVIATWVWALEGDADRAHASLLLAEGATFTGGPADGSASLESGIRIIRGAMAPLGVAQMLVDARRAVELEPPGSPWHPFATLLLGSAELLYGRPDRAAKAFERTAHLGREQQKLATALALAQLSLLAAERADWPAAVAYAGDAREVVRTARLQDHLVSMLSYAASAKLATHQGDRPTALLDIGNALRVYSGGVSSSGPTPVAFPWLAAQVAIALGQTLLDLDDVAAARLRVSEAREHLTRLSSQGTLREQMQQLSDDVARRGGSAEAGGIMTLTQAELRVLHLLSTHLSLAEIARELVVSRNTVKTHVAALYRKLRVTTRANAVQRGRCLGLLR